MRAVSAFFVRSCSTRVGAGTGHDVASDGSEAACLDSIDIITGDGRVIDHLDHQIGIGAIAVCIDDGHHEGTTVRFANEVVIERKREANLSGFQIDAGDDQSAVFIIEGLADVRDLDTIDKDCSNTVRCVENDRATCRLDIGFITRTRAFSNTCNGTSRQAGFVNGRNSVDDTNRIVGRHDDDLGLAVEIVRYDFPFFRFRELQLGIGK